MRLATTVVAAAAGAGILLIACAGAGPAAGPATAAPASRPGVGHFPHLEVDMIKREVRVECETLNPTMPLEFFCVLKGTSEHESVLRTEARPSHVHTALLMLGLKPGAPVKYSEKEKRWRPPTGDGVDVSVELRRDGRTVREAASSWMRDVKGKQDMPPPAAWVFAGSRVMPDGNYAADVTGYVVSVVNFDLTMIDIPRLASNANETLQWEYNPDRVPRAGTRVTMVLRPGGTEPGPTTGPATRPAPR